VDLPVHPDDLGLTTRRLALSSSPQGLGLSARAVEWRLSTGDWQALHRGVYLTRPGPVDWLTRACAALLAYGPQAALSGRSAAVVHDLVPMPNALWSPTSWLSPEPWQTPPPAIQVVVPQGSRPSQLRGTILRRARSAHVVARWPRRTTYEATVIDLAATGSADDLAALIGRALRGRRTSQALLRAELDSRRAHPRRELVAGLLWESSAGTEWPLEVRFVRDVLRRHGLPTGVAQLRVDRLGTPMQPALGTASPARHPGIAPPIVLASSDSPPPTSYRPAARAPSAVTVAEDRRRFDRALPDVRVIFELDGELFHAGARRRADRGKANLAARHEWLLLRYGWGETADNPCQTAAEVAQILTERGWPGRPRRCSPTCPVGPVSRPRAGGEG